MIRKLAHGFSRLNNVKIFDNVMKILRPFDVKINFEEILETVKILGKYGENNLYKLPFAKCTLLVYMSFSTRSATLRFQICCNCSEQNKNECKYPLTEIPSNPKTLSIFYNIYNYPQYFALPKLIYVLQKAHRLPISEESILMSVCLENIQLALSLHDLVDNINESLPKAKYSQQLLYQKMSDKRLVLGGDYFHAKASVLSANIKDKIEIPLFMSILEEEAAKGVFYEAELQDRLANKGPQSINLEDIYQLAYHKQASTVAYSTLIADIINNDLREEAFKAGLYLGLCIHFQAQLKAFIRTLHIITNNHLAGIVTNQESDCYRGTITLPQYYFQLKSQTTSVIQELHEYSLKETERVIQTMRSKAKEHFQAIGADFQEIDKLIEHFRIST